MCREKTDTILKVLVKHFFVEKEVTSTLVMDSLYTSLKALEYQMNSKKGSKKIAGLEEQPAPMVHIDMDMFVLAGDVIHLIKRAASEPLPCQPLAPKDDKTSQGRMKVGIIYFDIIQLDYHVHALVIHLISARGLLTGVAIRM